MIEVGDAVSDLIEQTNASKGAVEEYLAGELQTNVEVTDFDPSYGNRGEVYVAFDLPAMTETVEACLGQLDSDGSVDGSVVIDVGEGL